MIELSFPIKSDLIAKGTKRRSGQLMPKVGFIVAHDTGNPGSTARNNVDYYKRTAHEQSASAHLFVDDREAIECVPALLGKPEKAWHVHYDRPLDNKLYGDDANDIAIGVERCWGGKINDAKSYDNYVELLALICERFKLDPAKHIIAHGKLDPARRYDPMMSFEQDKDQDSTTMAKLVADVAERMSDEVMQDCKIVVDGKELEGFINKDGKVLTYLREISTALGAKVAWNAEEKKATVIK